MFEDPHFLLTPSKCLNQFLRFLAYFAAILIWTHLLIQNSPNFSNKVAPPGKINNSDFAFNECLRKVRIRCLANQSAQIAYYNQLQQYIKSQKYRNHPWSVWTLICSNAVIWSAVKCIGKVLRVRGISKWWRDLKHYFAAKRQIYQTIQWCFLQFVFK